MSLGSKESTNHNNCCATLEHLEDVLMLVSCALSVIFVVLLIPIEQFQLLIYQSTKHFPSDVLVCLGVFWQI